MCNLLYHNLLSKSNLSNFRATSKNHKKLLGLSKNKKFNLYKYKKIQSIKFNNLYNRLHNLNRTSPFKN